MLILTLSPVKGTCPCGIGIKRNSKAGAETAPTLRRETALSPSPAPLGNHLKPSPLVERRVSEGRPQHLQSRSVVTMAVLHRGDTVVYCFYVIGLCDPELKADTHRTSQDGILPFRQSAVLRGQPEICCSGLNQITFPAGLAQIGEFAF